MSALHLPAAIRTKKALRELFARERTPRLYLQDPSFVAPRPRWVGEMRTGDSVVVTNHPKRTFFAKITRTESGFRVQ